MNYWLILDVKQKQIQSLEKFTPEDGKKDTSLHYGTTPISVPHAHRIVKRIMLA